MKVLRLKDLRLWSRIEFLVPPHFLPQQFCGVSLRFGLCDGKLRSTAIFWCVQV